MDVAQVLASLGLDSTEFDASLGAAHQSLNNLSNQFEKLRFALPKVEVPKVDTSAISKEFEQQGKKMQLENYASKAREASDAVGKVSLSASAALKETQKLTSLGTKGFKMFSAAAAAVAASVSLISYNVLSIGSGFESQMAKVQAISGATAEEFDRLRDKAQQLGADLPITARDAGAAMEVLAQRGMSVANILGQVDDVINLSISQQYGLAESADSVSAAMLNFNMSIDETGKIVDAFNNAANQSALSMSSLGSALTYVAPNANAVGMSLYETLAAMEALANAGFSGHRIGTGLTDVISSLAAPTDKASNALSRLGVQVNDSSGKMRPLRDILVDLRAANMTFIDSVDIFGTAGAKYGEVLAKNSNLLRDFETGLHQTGSTAKNVAIQMATLENKWKAFKSATEDISIKAFSQVEGQTKSLVDEITELARATGDWVDETQVADRAFKGFLQSLGIGDGTISGLTTHLNDLTAVKIEDFFSKSGTAIRNVVDGIASLASAVPWELIINNLDTIAASLFWTMIADKGIATATNVLQIATALKTLGVAASTVGSAAGAGAAIGALGYSMYQYAAAREELRKETGRGLEMENDIAQLELVAQVLSGEIELIDQLTPKYRALVEARKAAAEADAISQEKDSIAKQLKDDLDAGRIAAEEYEKEIQRLNGAATAFEYQNLQAADSFAKRYRDILERAQAGKISGDEERALTYSLFFEFNEKSFNFMEIKNRIEKEMEENPVSAKSIFDLDAVRPQIESKADEIVRSLKERLAGAESAFGRGTAEFAAAAAGIFEEATKKADEFADEQGKLFGANGPLAVAKVFKEMGAAGLPELDRIISKMEVTETQAKRSAEQLSGIKDAIKYLNVSPTTLIAGLEDMLKKTSMIDEVTGGVNKEYKTLYDTLNDIRNMEFGKLANQMKELSSAAAKGLVNPKAAEDLAIKYAIALENKLRAEAAEIPGSAKVKEGVYRSKLQDVVTAGNEPQEVLRLLASMLEKFNSQMPSTTYTSSFTEKGTLGRGVKVEEVFGRLDSDIKTTSDSFKKLNQQIDAISTGISAPGSTRVNVPNVSQMGGNPVRAISQVDRQQGTSALFDTSSVTAVLQPLTSRAKELLGAIESHGTKVEAQTGAMGELTTVLTKQSGGENATVGGATTESRIHVEINLQDFTVKQESDALMIARLIRKELQRLLKTPAANGV